MKLSDLVFFPQVEPSHFYVLVFKLKQPQILLIDSKNKEGSIDDLYELNSYAMEGHVGWSILRVLDHEHMSMRWKAKENEVDQGVILMQNMETYMGEDAKSGIADCTRKAQNRRDS